jgi:transcriptional regulator with XRE-family HTH domain
MSQGGLATLLGVSRRTISRWTSGGGVLGPHHGEALARALYPVDRELARQAAARGGHTVESLGLVASAPSPRVAQIVLCAAAEAMDASPRAVRPALLAAFRAAREEGFTLEAVERSLEAMSPSPHEAAARAK